MMSRLNRVDVAALRGKAPGVANTDELAVWELIETGRILKSHDIDERQHIWEAICANSADYMNPSMSTFLKD
jgi:hypothetical protein